MMAVVQQYPSVLLGNWGAATPGKPLWQQLLQSSKEPLGFQAFWACLLGLPGGVAGSSGPQRRGGSSHFSKPGPWVWKLARTSVGAWFVLNIPH